MMKAIHFGAGNIGRGFIGLLLHRAGYEVVFADVVDQMIDELNRTKSYRVVTLDAQIQTEIVENVRAVRLDSDECVEEIAEATLITTAVGMGNLAAVAKIIAKGLQIRHIRNPNHPVNIMACENGIRATSFLRHEVMNYADAQLCSWIESMVGFADVAVDRIAPNRDGYAIEPLDAVVESYFEWDIEYPALKDKLDLPGATFVEQLDPYLERKLFILNGAHVAAAYAGYQKHYETILDAMQDSQVMEIVSALQHEAILGLVNQHSLDIGELEQYAMKVRERFLNPHIQDAIQRVGRDPLRKLSPNDRLVRPLMMARAVIDETPGLISTIALAFLYDSKEDKPAVQIQEEIFNKGIAPTVIHVTGITDEKIISEIIATYANLKTDFS